jgi:hypothetical protein
MKYDLEEIKKVELREIWKHEALDFTKWLAQENNLEKLGKDLGIEINLIQTEANVGSFNVDILAEETITNKKIIIENQLETTNHDHLGKLITYAAGHDAAIIIWIVKDVREEHHRAIEWLNQHSDEGIGFFLIKIELWKIGDSKAAPNFEVISSPNEWAKVIKSSKINQTVSENDLQYFEIWKRFTDYLAEQNLNINIRKPAPKYYFDIAFGTSDAHMTLNLSSSKKLINCGIYIPQNRDLYDYLKSKKEKIEKEVNSKLTWIEASKASRIYINEKVNNLFDVNSSSKINKWFLEKYLLLSGVFKKYIEEYKH